MDIEQIRLLLRDRNIQAVARATGMSAATIYRIAHGRTRVHKRTIKDLTAYLTTKEAAPT